MDPKKCRRYLTRTVLVLAIASLVVSAEAQQSSAAVNPAAIKALNDMASYLRNLKAFQVESATTTDEVQDNGQLIQYTAKINFVVQMPNKLLATASSDRNERTFIYDGKTFTMFAQRAGYYATVPAPPTLRELDDALSEKYDIELPLADLFRFGSPDWKGADIKEATDIGPSEVSGITCEHYAFRQDDVDWQVWIQKGEYPLPRKLVITTTTEAARPQHTATYTWNLAPSYNEASFTFVPPAGARKIVLATVGEPQGGK
jgi:hypothetical protein